MIVQGISLFSTTTNKPVNKPVALQLEGDRIVAVNPLEQSRDLPCLAPGFLDIQVNGFMDSDYSLEDFSAEQVGKIVSYLDRSGTTQHLPTIITSPEDRILRNLRTIARAVEADKDLEQGIPGIHIEGPYISPEDGARGAHDASFVRPPDIEEVKRWQEAAGGRIRVITLSPEWEGAPGFIEEITAMGIIASIGHTAADGKQIRTAVEAGARMSTHLGNGSHTVIPRLRNYIWEQLAEDRLLAGIISDGFHLPDAVLKVFTRAKGPERLILVSDAAHLAGFKPGIYRRGNIEAQVFEDGHLGLPGTEILAGAAHLLDWDIPHFAAVTGLDLGEIIPLVTTNPAHLLGLEPGYGSLAPGAPANLVLFEHEPQQRRLKIVKTIRAGKVVYSG
jgi:N-acetylglucosamine-6-phosphate deacetylase